VVRLIVSRVALAAGLALLVTGVALVWMPAAFIVAGLAVAGGAVVAIGGER